MTWIADVAWRHARLVLSVVGVVALLAAAFAHDVESRLDPAGFTDPASESKRGAATLRDALGYDADPAIVILVRAHDGGVLGLHSPRVQAEVARIAGRLARARGVGHVYNPLAQTPIGSGVARDRRSLVLSAHLRTSDVEEKGHESVEDADEAIRSTLLETSLAGFAPGFAQLTDQTRRDLTTAEMIAFPALAVLLFFVFQGLLPALIPLVVGGVSIVATMLVLRIASAYVDLSLYALNIATALSLGLAVDYALLLISRYREEAARHGHGYEAHRATVLGAGRGVLFSGLTVAGGMAPLLLMPQRFLYSLGLAGVSVGVMSVLAALFVVPAALALLGRRVDSRRARSGARVERAEASARWRRLAWFVMKRPRRVAIASAVLMLVLGIPLVGAHFTGASARAVPPGLPSYEPQRYLATHYPRDAYEAITITVQGAATDAQLAGYRGRVADVEGIAAVTAFRRVNGNVAYATAAADGPALDDRAMDALGAARRLTPPGEASVFVSGNTARFVDLKISLRSHTPLVVALVVAATLLLLFMLTGSVLLPIKTLVMNLLTLSAMLGVLTLVFQHGVLRGLLDYPGPNTLEIVTVIFLLVATFALSTDYAVMVLTRIKEGHDAGLSDQEAVAEGIARTGRTISAAALALTLVFLAFGVSPIYYMKQIAIGTAVGVMLDATIVRAMLVPALMRLLGPANWWAPRPLRAVHRRFALREGG